ncbi:MAG TPA: hypothetical protein VM327_09790 [Candidatus Thermoplasmatota archaeon]|nr:hypothetical protein [Candidatus Thermoplasmatota archaeon]
MGVTAEADEPRAGKLDPIGAPTDPLRPTGPLDPDEATRKAKARMARAARKLVMAIVIVGCAAAALIILGVLAKGCS